MIPGILESVFSLSSAAGRRPPVAREPPQELRLPRSLRRRTLLRRGRHWSVGVQERSDVADRERNLLG